MIKTTNLLRSKKDHLINFLEQTKKANEIVPTVKRALELTNWNIDVITKAPVSIKDYFEDQSITKIIEADTKIWLKELPINPINLLSVNTLASGASGTASEVVFNTVLSTSLTQPKEPEIKDWFENSRNQYFLIQQKQKREEEIYKKLLTINNSLAKEFLLANNEYIKTISSVSLPQDSANSMRNVLNHYIGNLVESIRRRLGVKKQVKKNPVAQWTFVADNSTTPGSPEHTLLINKSDDHRALIMSLTDISKNTSKNALEELENVYSRWIEHIYTSTQLAGY